MALPGAMKILPPYLQLPVLLDRLPESGRDPWFDALEAHGLENVPLEQIPRQITDR